MCVCVCTDVTEVSGVTCLRRRQDHDQHTVRQDQDHHTVPLPSPPAKGVGGSGGGWVAMGLASAASAFGIGADQQKAAVEGGGGLRKEFAPSANAVLSNTDDEEALEPQEREEERKAQERNRSIDQTPQTLSPHQPQQPPAAAHGGAAPDVAAAVTGPPRVAGETQAEEEEELPGYEDQGVTASGAQSVGDQQGEVPSTVMSEDKEEEDEVVEDWEEGKEGAGGSLHGDAAAADDSEQQEAEVYSEGSSDVPHHGQQPDPAYVHILTKDVRVPTCSPPAPMLVLNARR